MKVLIIKGLYENIEEKLNVLYVLMKIYKFLNIK